MSFFRVNFENKIFNLKSLSSCVFVGRFEWDMRPSFPHEDIPLATLVLPFDEAKILSGKIGSETCNDCRNQSIKALMWPFASLDFRPQDIIDRWLLHIFHLSYFSKRGWECTRTTFCAWLTWHDIFMTDRPLKRGPIQFHFPNLRKKDNENDFVFI